MIVSAALGELILPLVVGQVSVLSTPSPPFLPPIPRIPQVVNCFSCSSISLRFHKATLVNQQQQEIRSGEYVKISNVISMLFLKH